MGRAVFGVFFVVTVLVWLPIRSAYGRDLLEEEKLAIAKGVKMNLLDPESARFKWLPVTKEGAGWYCGLVNSKNRLGGYAGDAPYMVQLVWVDGRIKGAFPLTVGSANPEATATIVAVKMCTDKGYELYLAQ